jgi:hypothetical protein
VEFGIKSRIFHGRITIPLLPVERVLAARLVRLSEACCGHEVGPPSRFVQAIVPVLRGLPFDDSCLAVRAKYD